RVAEGTVEAERVEELLIEMAGQRIERADRLGPEPVPDVDQQVEAADTDALEDVDFEMGRHRLGCDPDVAGVGVETDLDPAGDHRMGDPLAADLPGQDPVAPHQL